MVSFSFNLVIMLSFLVLGLMFVGSVSAKGCEFPAIYNFGDPSSDTGGISAAKSQVTSPNGETFFGHPAGRSCDSRLFIDFIGKQANRDDKKCAMFYSFSNLDAQYCS